ncbi:chloride channel protein [Desertivirga arenae]|uniref:chloride channel protein n=1 Tax=Desertivirga arenae TaxID=2810309 RepID=UPI001A975E05|nr:chloride channel protein [Pedobacter sp. SYSU D00823]
MLPKGLPDLLLFTFKWLGLATLVGILAGSASALFLISLAEATSIRQENSWLFYFLPVAGLLVGLIYYYLGKDVEKGNNQIIDEVIEPQQKISWRMAPLVLIGTLLTHVAGGSAGREGTAVQMGGSLADQLNHFFQFSLSDRRTLLVCGVSAGFASVFGTPLAGTVFALEVYIIGKMRYESLIPALFAAITGDFICKLWGAHHTHYHISSSTELTVIPFLLAIAAGLIFALGGWLFTNAIPFFKQFFNKVSFPPLRPFVGGIILVVLFLVIDKGRFAGLGVETIVESFSRRQPLYFFLLKILLTSLTLASGFKGGEVTPLFFVGATLGSAIALFIPLPADLLAAMGFVAVFAAAANTPLACILMGIELFGSEHSIFIAIACIIAYLFSGHTGIYSSQQVGSPKHAIWGLHKRKRLKDLNSN